MLIYSLVERSSAMHSGCSAHHVPQDSTAALFLRGRNLTTSHLRCISYKDPTKAPCRDCCLPDNATVDCKGDIFSCAPLENVQGFSFESLGAECYRYRDAAGCVKEESCYLIYHLYPLSDVLEFYIAVCSAGVLTALLVGLLCRTSCPPRMNKKSHQPPVLGKHIKHTRPERVTRLPNQGKEIYFLHVSKYGINHAAPEWSIRRGSQNRFL